MLAGTVETMQLLVNITGCKLLLQDDRSRTSFQISTQSMPQTMANVQYNILVSIIHSHKPDLRL